ncbi:hypothetical protein A2V82_02220 [candidate division KSB1 bacterium RBG_16_48_16]|nr:MAG: hypothetical protein A2V82_02220 [candidate division KSB1 bacterium RBG_16_48_16]
MTDSAFFNWVILPALIFCARIIDVSIGTMRIVYIGRGKKFLAPLLGFFEVFIWLIAIGQIFKHLDNVACYFGWAGGFAMGNYVGMVIEDKLAIGAQILRIICREDSQQITEHLKSEGYGITLVNAEGTAGAVKIIFTVVMRKDLPKVLGIMKQHNPKAFYTVEDVQRVREAVFPLAVARPRWFILQLLKMDRKKK